MKKISMLILTLIVCAFASWAQSADSVTKMIESQKVTYGQISYFTAIQSNLVTEVASNEEAFAALKNSGVITKDCQASDFIPLEDFAYLCTRAWDIQGSLLYQFFPSPRYALRLLKAKNFIPASYDPFKNLSGRDALNIIYKCAESQETQ